MNRWAGRENESVGGTLLSRSHAGQECPAHRSILLWRTTNNSRDGFALFRLLPHLLRVKIVAIKFQRVEQLVVAVILDFLIAVVACDDELWQVRFRVEPILPAAAARQFRLGAGRDGM